MLALDSVLEPQKAPIIHHHYFGPLFSLAGARKKFSSDERGAKSGGCPSPFRHQA
jgi:hypothetical protein